MRRLRPSACSLPWRRCEQLPFQRKAAGILVNLEVEEVDAEYARAVAAGLKIHVSLRDEPFGQRHFITEDPNGVAFDVIKPIPLSPEFAKQFAAAP